MPRAHVINTDIETRLTIIYILQLVPLDQDSSQNFALYSSDLIVYIGILIHKKKEEKLKDNLCIYITIEYSQYE